MPIKRINLFQFSTTKMLRSIRLITKTYNKNQFFKIIRPDQCVVVTTLGKYSGTYGPGLKFYIPMIQRLKRLSTLIKTHKSEITIRTQDDVIVTLKLDVNWNMNKDDAETFLFKVDDSVVILDGFINDETRTLVKDYNLERLMNAREELKSVIQRSLSERTSEYGIRVKSVILTDIHIPKALSDAMASITTTKKEMEASRNKAEMEKIFTTKNAEAHRDQMILQGEGIAGMRQKIIDGYEHSIVEMSNRLGVDPKHVMEFITNTMMLDAYKELAKSTGSKTVFFPTTIKDPPFVWNSAMK